MTFHMYRPHRADPELLEKITVGREPLLQEILERLEAWEPGASRQHDLFIGPRGIGKSHLLQLVEHRLRTRPELSEKWVPLRIAEEFYGASRVSDLLLEALRLLTEEEAGRNLKTTYDEVRYDDDDTRVRDRCLDIFRGFHREKGRGVLLMIENLDRVLDQQVKRKIEVQQLRRILIEEDWIVTLCTSPTYLNAISQPEAPFFEFFRVRTLAEMTPEEQAQMMQRLAAAEQSDDLNEYLRKFQSRLRALYHFTGGNPRLTLMLYGLVVRYELGGVKSELDLLLDQLTPFYQDRMKEVSDQEAKILETMSLLPEGTTPTELATEIRLDPKIVRATMSRLERAGYVQREERRQKRTVYIVPERLFRIWHQMNHSRSARGRIQFLLEFFASWYSNREERDLAWDSLSTAFESGLENERLDDIYEYMDYVVAVSEGGERILRAFDRLRSLMAAGRAETVLADFRRMDHELGSEDSYFYHKGYFLSNDFGDGEKAVDLFTTTLQTATSPWQRAASAAALGRLNAFDGVDILIEALDDKSNDVRISAINALSHLGAREAVEPLLNALKDPKPQIRGHAAAALGRLGSGHAIGPLLAMLNDEDHINRGSAATALGKLNAVEATNALIGVLEDKSPSVRRRAAAALGLMSATEAVAPLIETLKDDDFTVRRSAAAALDRMKIDLDVKQTHQLAMHIFSNEEKFLPKELLPLFRLTFRQGSPTHLRELVSAFQKVSASHEALRPYIMTCDYLESECDPALLERQHPEMREAVLLLVRGSEIDG